MKNKKLIATLAIEMTRQCNMNCDFCAKGMPQNIDISKEIIDKTFDEVKDSYIHTLRISGGEPTLVPDLVDYLVDKIIEKRISIGSVFMFTNGVVKNNKLIDSLKKLLKYLKIIAPHLRDYANVFNKYTSNAYESTQNKKIAIIISTFYHDNKDILKDTVRFYNQINDDDFCVIKQSDDFVELKRIIVEGNAVRNYSKILSDQLSLEQIRVIDNNYFFIAELNDCPGYKIFKKTISISSNGNVFVGSLSSYKNVDNNPMFNITNCNENFFEKIESWCWLHPVSEDAKRLKEKYKSIIFCREHNLKVSDISDDDFVVLTFAVGIAEGIEKICKELHKMYSSFKFYEILIIATSIQASNLLDISIPKEKIILYLTSITGFSADYINKYMFDYRGLFDYVQSLVRKYSNFGNFR